MKKYGIRKGSVEIWGTGIPLREFLWSEEMANACIYIMERINFTDLKPIGKEIRNTHINIGTEKEISIRQLVEIIAETIKYEGTICFNDNKPDGTMRK